MFLLNLAKKKEKCDHFDQVNKLTTLRMRVLNVLFQTDSLKIKTHGKQELHHEGCKIAKI